MPRKRKSIRIPSVHIFDAGAQGKSVAKAPDGRIIFLKSGVPGDKVEVEVVLKKGSYYEGKVIQNLTFSEDRVPPRCEHFGECGGCKWQNMSYQKQLFYKQKEVANNLRRLGGLDLPEGLAILPSPLEFEYRNKMEYSFSDNRWLSREEINNSDNIPHRKGLGFHKSGMWDKVLDIQHCHLQSGLANDIRNAIRDIAIEKGFSFFNFKSKTGLLRSLMIRTNIKDQIMVLIQFHDNNELEIKELMEWIKERFPMIRSLLYVVNQKANDSLYDQQIHCYSGLEYIEEKLGDLNFHIGAKTFFQTNTLQAKALYDRVVALADLSGNELVLDLYSGIGTISLYLAKCCREVIGVEVVPESVQSAIENAKRNGCSNARFICGDMSEIMKNYKEYGIGLPDVVIADPPREGMQKPVLEKLLNLLPRQIIYVSCNSSTQARDLSFLKEAYKIDSWQPIDMFPHTHHVENIVLLSRTI